MSQTRFAFLVMTLLIVSAGAAQAAEPQAAGAQTADEPGLHMNFYTNLGTIHCKLYENEAPLTVRTVVGLATGRKSYIDPATKKMVSGKRFYNGLTFHRVMPKFMIQGGDPLGTGEGSPEGPGFPFKDEFVPTLKFDVAGRLAMANAGPGTHYYQCRASRGDDDILADQHLEAGCFDSDLINATGNEGAVKSPDLVVFVL